MDQIVVVGASLAGVSAAEALRTAGYQGSVVLFGAEPELPYDRPPLSKGALAGDVAVDAISLHPSEWYDTRGIELHLGRRVIGLDPRTRTLGIAGGETVGYDGLIIASGTSPRPIPDIHPADGASALRTARDSAQLCDRLRSASRVLILGAGFIGLEVAAVAAGLGLDVVVVEKDQAPLANVLGAQVGQWLVALHGEQGVDIRCGVTVSGVSRDGDLYRAELDDRTALTADVVVAATGVVPTTDWLHGSGLSVSNGVVCDEYCATSAPDVTAAGDVCRWYNPLFDETMRIEHWTNAREQGRAAALRLVGEADGPYGPVPTFWSDQYDAKLRFAGRTTGATQVVVDRPADGSLVARYERDGTVRAVLCVNAPRELVRYRAQIQAGVRGPRTVVRQS